MIEELYIYISLLGQPYESCCCPFLDAYHQEKVIVYSDGRWLKGDKVEGFFQLPKPDLVQSKECTMPSFLHPGGLGVANNGAKLKLLSWSHPCTGFFSLKKCIYMHLSAFWRFPCKGPSRTVGTSKHFAGFSNFQPSAASHHRGRLSSGPHSGKHCHSWLENGPGLSRCILLVFPIEDGHISLLCWFTRGKQKPVPVANVLKDPTHHPSNSKATGSQGSRNISPPKIPSTCVAGSWFFRCRPQISPSKHSLRVLVVALEVHPKRTWTSLSPRNSGPKRQKTAPRMAMATWCELGDLPQPWIFWKSEHQRPFKDIVPQGLGTWRNMIQSEWYVFSAQLNQVKHERLYERITLRSFRLKGGPLSPNKIRPNNIAHDSSPKLFGSIGFGASYLSGDSGDLKSSCFFFGKWTSKMGKSPIVWPVTSVGILPSLPTKPRQKWWDGGGNFTCWLELVGADDFEHVLRMFANIQT